MNKPLLDTISLLREAAVLLERELKDPGSINLSGATWKALDALAFMHQYARENGKSIDGLFDNGRGARLVIQTPTAIPLSPTPANKKGKK